MAQPFRSSIVLPKLLQDLAIEKFNLARRVQGTHHPWNSVDDETKAFFTLLERRLGESPFGGMSWGCHRLKYK